MTKVLTHRGMIIDRWQRIALKITPFGLKKANMSLFGFVPYVIESTTKN